MRDDRGSLSESVAGGLAQRLQEAQAEIERLKAPQPCGHPGAAIVVGEARGDNHVHHCGWCADVERYRVALERIAQKCDVWEVRAKHALHDPPWWNLGDIARAILKEPSP